MNDAVYKFKRYEDASLEYIGINKHADDDVGLYDTVISADEFKQDFIDIDSFGKTLRLKEHEIVVATTKIATVPKGATGTVVHSYANGDAYEVEFIINGKSMVETALKNQIEKK